MRFSEKTVVVAGGTGGIGSEVARGVVREGGNVLLVARDPARLAERVAELAALAGRPGAAEAFAADAGSLAELSRAAAAAVARHGRLDGWVHAVGSILLKPLSATSEEEWAGQLDRNAGSAFRALHAALGPMRKQRGGSIVLFGSAAAAKSFSGLISNRERTISASAVAPPRSNTALTICTHVVAIIPPNNTYTSITSPTAASSLSW